MLLQANPRYLLLVLTARDVVDENDENDDAFASSREDEVLLNLHEAREPPPPPPITVTPLEREDESVVKLISIAHYSFERRREKEYTFSIRRVIFVRDFLSKKKGRSRRCFFLCERSPKRKRKIRTPPEKNDSSFFPQNTFLCFKTTAFYYARRGTHIYINE